MVDPLVGHHGAAADRRRGDEDHDPGAGHPTAASPHLAHQYRWDGTDDISSVFEYSHCLGPRHQLTMSSLALRGNSNSSASSLHILPLSLQEVQHLISLQRQTIPGMAWTGEENSFSASDATQGDLDAFRGEFVAKVDSFLSSISSECGKWFLKTNRHSCKDSPLDSPNEKDLALFAEELDRYPVPAEHLKSLDDVDFGSAFLAMCRSRLESTAVRNGEDVLSLLIRSKRIYGDFTLQVRLQPIPWDCYLAFSPYDDQMAQYPLHEFRCYLSNRQVRCIMQYSYLITCPIPPEEMPSAVQTIVTYLYHDFLPSLSQDILDVAVDVQCIPSNSSKQFEIKFIETNPLGPGTVWGHLSWDGDRSWLLFDPQDAQNVSILPSEAVIPDSQGGERRVQWYHPADGCVCVVLYTSRHPLGMLWGALAHIPPDYMLVLWEKWRLEELQEAENGAGENKKGSVNERDESPSSCVCS